MAKSRNLETQAARYIKEQMLDRGSMTTEEVMDLIRPHFLFDSLSAKEQLIRRKAGQLMASLRDECGVRKCFSTGDREHPSVYINVERTEDVGALIEVDKQLTVKYAGLNASRKKVRSRLQDLSGQITFDDEQLGA